MHKFNYEQIVAEVGEKLAIVARYVGEIGWVKDAVARGNFDGIKIDTAGNVSAMFSGLDWQDEIAVSPNWLEERELEKMFSALATANDKATKSARQLKLQNELAAFRHKYKALVRETTTK